MNKTANHRECALQCQTLAWEKYQHLQQQQQKCGTRTATALLSVQICVSTTQLRMDEESIPTPRMGKSYAKGHGSKKGFSIGLHITLDESGIIISHRQRWGSHINSLMCEIESSEGWKNIYSGDVNCPDTVRYLRPSGWPFEPMKVCRVEQIYNILEIRFI